MAKLKLMTIIGTRPEIIRLSETIKACDKYFDQILVHTGQNYDYTLNQVFFEDLGLRAPDFYLNAVGADLGETIGNIIAASYKLMREQKPDAVLVLGDTNSCLSVIAAKRLHIPIFHMEAPVPPWRRCCTGIWRRSRPPTFSRGWVWKRANTSCSPPTGRRTSTLRPTSSPS